MANNITDASITPPSVKRVTPQHNYQLSIEFDNGESGVLDIVIGCALRTISLPSLNILTKVSCKALTT